jgi:hypothetical protein
MDSKLNHFIAKYVEKPADLQEEEMQVDDSDLIKEIAECLKQDQEVATIA